MISNPLICTRRSTGLPLPAIRPRHLAPVLLAGLLVALSPCAGAQESAPTPGAADLEPTRPASTFTEQLSVSWVLVPVVVRGSRGYAQGLDRDDFRLWVDGRRVPIQELDLGSDAPLSVVWLQDLSGSMANSGKLEISRLAFETFLDGARPGDEIAVASFAGDEIQVEVPFTDDVDALGESVAAWEGYGTTALHDAVSLLPDISADAERGKRVAVLVTDGLDNASRLTPEQSVDLVRRARLPVYVLGLNATPPRSGDSAEGADGEDVYRYADLLRSLAEATGGRYFEIVTAQTAEPEEPLRRTLGEILDDLRLRYILALTTAASGEKSYHRFRVEVLRHGHSGRNETLTYRRGYWGPAPSAWSEPR